MLGDECGLRVVDIAEITPAQLIQSLDYIKAKREAEQKAARKRRRR